MWVRRASTLVIHHRSTSTITNTLQQPFLRAADATTTTTTTGRSVRHLSSLCPRLGLGGRPSGQYESVVQTALQNGITTFEATDGGGELALANAYRAAIQTDDDILKNTKIQILWRLGYRLVDPPDDNENKGGDDDADGENKEEEQQSKNRSPLEGDVLQSAPPEDAADDGSSSSDGPVVYHNLSPEYLQTKIANDGGGSPLMELQKEFSDSIQLVVMLHNPEVQVFNLDDIRERQLSLKKIFENTRETLDGMHFGITSNGLCLPEEHPLHLNPEVFFASFANNPKFQIVQLPANALETTGLRVAQKIQASKTKHGLDHLQICGMRPLLCFPDAGTGTGRPFELVDKQIPMSPDESVWTNELEECPPVYEQALKMVMAHFDAHEILEKDQDLTTEERETLDGCKLVQSLLHDLDNNLETYRSHQVYEDMLMQQVIPAIQGTFESYDEESSRVLQSFFAAYGLAVRYYVSKNTRQLLLTGEKVKSKEDDKDGGDGDNSTTTASATMPAPPTYTEDELPQSKRLQEFALGVVLNARQNHNDSNAPAIDKVMVGCTDTDQVLDNISIVNNLK